MLKNNVIKLIQVSFLIAALISLRGFEEQLFYDPFIKFFKGNFINKPFPDLNMLKLFFSYLARFAINTVLSLVIIFVLFKKSSYIKVASALYVILFVVLESSLSILLKLNDTNTYVYMFYIRRFIVQPLFLLLFVGAFYYQSFAYKQNRLQNKPS